MSTSDNTTKNAVSEDGNSKDKAFTPSDIFHLIENFGIQLPPFWPDEPALWFVKIEAIFALSGVNDDDTKYYYVITQLERYAAEVKDILLNPPVKEKYEQLKSELIKRLSASRKIELTQQFLHEEIGDRRPSAFLHHLQHLAGACGIPDDFIKTVWIRRLPEPIKIVVASLPDSSLMALADLADKVHDLLPPAPQAASKETISESMIEKLSKEINELSLRVQALSKDSRSRSRERSRRDRSTTRSHSNYRKFPTCIFHHRFGNSTRRCLKPCDYQPSSRNASGCQ